MDQAYTSKTLNRIISEGKCIGCGLCASMFPEQLSIRKTSSGYLRPAENKALSNDQTEALWSVCPGVVQTGLPEQHIAHDTAVDDIWGPIRHVVTAHASNPSVRFRGSTGGVLTALCQYLVEGSIVSYVSHVTASADNPGHGDPFVSQTSEQVLQGSGSRYGPSAPLMSLYQHLDKDEPFAIVAKPCDISAVRRLALTEPRINDLVRYFLTPVCGGFMPPFALDNFFKRTGVNPSDVVSLSYRGNGCPGPTRIELSNGEVIEKTYLDLWGTDASMWHLAWRCKICPDGTGEGADIAVADTWRGGSPDPTTLDSDPGTNAIIVRTVAGGDLIDGAVAAGFLEMQGESSIEDLNHWQPHQVTKKIASQARYRGMLECDQLPIRTPGMANKRLLESMTEQTRLAQTEGTVERIKMGKHSDDWSG
ncbi:MAG: Coenzyme F420 hydrogenase/dehydrogenase, beta subunit C-terminal domain [Pseudomonadota bacterium]